MASVIHVLPPTPKQAVRRKARLDRLLEPEMLKALAEPMRARLLSCLLKCGRPCSVTEVAECCLIDFSMVARHLATLARAGLLSSEKKGRTVWYAAEGLALAAHFRALAEAIDELTPAVAKGDTQDCGCRAACRNTGCEHTSRDRPSHERVSSVLPIHNPLKEQSHATNRSL